MKQKIESPCKIKGFLLEKLKTALVPSPLRSQTILLTVLIFDNFCSITHKGWYCWITWAKHPRGFLRVYLFRKAARSSTLETQSLQTFVLAMTHRPLELRESYHLQGGEREILPTRRVETLQNILVLALRIGRGFVWLQRRNTSNRRNTTATLYLIILIALGIAHALG